MATTAQNNVLLPLALPVPYQCKTDGTADVVGGDLVYFDTSAKVVKSLDSDTHATNLAGLALNGSFIQPYTTKMYGAGIIPVLQKGIASLFQTAADTYQEDTAVYFGADAQTITSQSASHIVGYTKMPYGVTSITGAAGSRIAVLLAVQDPTSAFA